MTPRIPRFRRPFRLGLDLDGIFADWNSHAVRTFAQLTGRALGPPGDRFYPNVWDWPRALGYRQSEVKAFWAHVETDPGWWARIAPYEDAPRTLALVARLRDEEAIASVTFLTSRPGQTAHAQSCDWLELYGFTRPQVCICGSHEEKGWLARGLRLDAFVDDYWDNLAALHRASPATALAFYSTPYGAAREAAMRGIGAVVIRGQMELRLRLRKWAGKDAPDVPDAPDA